MRESTQRRLKSLARASSPMRDHEVMLEWLDRVAREAGCADVAARIRRLADERRPAGDLAFDVKPGLEPQARKGAVPFGRWFASQVAMMIEHIERDEWDLSAGRSGFHAARIQVKHLCYLLDPMRERFAAVEPMLADLEVIQERLGDLHDLAAFRAYLADYAGWLLTDALPAPLARPGKPTRPLSQTFTGVRDDVIRLSAWQSARFEAMWRDWETRRPALEKRLYTARNRLIREFEKAAPAAN